MIFLKNGNDFYHSAILDAIDEELTNDFDEKTAAMLRQDISIGLSKLIADDGDGGDNTFFQNEIKQMLYPILAAHDTLKKCGVPGKVATKFLLDLWDRIPVDKKNEEMWNALLGK